jgi:hypothetical protein
MIVPPYIAALGSCDLSWGVNERIIANSLIEHRERLKFTDSGRMTGNLEK